MSESSWCIEFHQVAGIGIAILLIGVVLAYLTYIHNSSQPGKSGISSNASSIVAQESGIR